VTPACNKEAKYSGKPHNKGPEHKTGRSSGTLSGSEGRPSPGISALEDVEEGGFTFSTTGEPRLKPMGLYTEGDHGDNIDQLKPETKGRRPRSKRI